eukprot:1864293-Pyramimonas_sp.AAC.1
MQTCNAEVLAANAQAQVAAEALVVLTEARRAMGLSTTAPAFGAAAAASAPTPAFGSGGWPSTSA